MTRSRTSVRDLFVLRRHVRAFLDKRTRGGYNRGMKYIELTVHTTSEASELVADVLWDYSEGGVAVSDARDVVALIRQHNSLLIYYHL